MQYQLVLGFRRRSLDNHDFVAVLEQELKQAFAGTAEVDGHDVGSRAINLFIITPDPASSFRRAKPVLERLQLLDKVAAAHRLLGGARFTVIWPLGSARKFSVE